MYAAPPADESSADPTITIDDPPLTDEELLAEVIAEERAASVASLRRAARLAELDRRGITDRLKGTKTAGYLAGVCPADPARLARDIKLGKTMRQYPELAAAAYDGRISVDHLHAVARAANPRVRDVLVEHQDRILTFAGGLFARFTRELAGLVEELDQDGGHDPRGDEAKNRLTAVKTFDGVLHLAGTLFGGDADAALHALNDRADELYLLATQDRDVTSDLPVPERTSLLARALMDLLLAGRAVDRGSSIPPRPEVTFVVNAGEPGEVFDPFGIKVQDGTTRRAFCDPVLYPIVIDSLGVPLDMGRAVRLATPAQRRAVLLRDGGCVFPFCDARDAWCETHHVDHWTKGGRTDLDVLAPLCRHHHGVTHRKGWVMHATADGWFWWTTPAGETFWSQRHGHQRAGPTPSG